MTPCPCPRDAAGSLIGGVHTCELHGRRSGTPIPRAQRNPAKDGNAKRRLPPVLLAAYDRAVARGVSPEVIATALDLL